MSVGQGQDQKPYLIPIEKDQRPFKCGLCSFAFDEAAKLNTHISEHSHTKPFQCGYCLASYDSGSDLARHVDTHQLIMCVAKRAANENLSPAKGLAPGTVGVTRKPQFQNRAPTSNSLPVTIDSNLLSGMLRLEEGQCLRRAYTCTVCRLSYDLQKDFKKHCLLVHLNDRPFPCAQCPARFKAKKDLVKHVPVMHGFEKPFECELCGKRFKIKSYQQLHMRKWHPGAKLGRIGACVAGNKLEDRDSVKKRNEEPQSQPSLVKMEMPDAENIGGRGEGVVD